MPRFTLFLALTLAAAALFPEVAAVEARGGPPRYQDVVQEETLPNGLRVLLLEDRRAPVVSLQVWYRVGSRNEVLGKTGLAHLLEHMMFKGTPRFGPKTFSQTIGRSGGDDNAFTTKDATIYFENIASENVEIAVELEADRMTHLLLDPKDFRAERDVVIEERRMRTEDDPGRELSEQLDAAVFTSHPYMNPVVGWMGDIQNLTHEDALAFYKRYYRPSNAVVIVVGDFSAVKMLALIRKHFGPLPKLPAPETLRVAEPAQKGPRRVVLRRPAQLPIVRLSYHAPRIGDPDFAPLEVLDAVFSSGRSARLLQNLVFKESLATYAGASYDGISVDPSTFSFYAQVFPKRNPREVEEALRVEIAAMRERDVPEAEIDKAKTQIEADWYRSQDSMFYRGMLLGNFAMAGDWREIDGYLPAIREVNGKDLRRAAKRVFSDSNETSGALEPTAPITGHQTAAAPGGEK